jgi:hypothetical protein
MGDLLGSLIQGSQKQTILCVIGVGCYIDGLTWENKMAVGGAFVSYFINLFTMGPIGDYSPCLQPIMM